MSELHKETNQTVSGTDRSIARDSELVIGLVGAVGTDLDKITEQVKLRLSHHCYQKQIVRISNDIIEPLSAEFRLKQKSNGENPGDRIDRLMTNGDKIRQLSGKNDILALGTASQISLVRQKANEETHSEQKIIPRAFIVRSLKHPDEVAKFREIYSSGFYLIGVHCDEMQRKKHLVDDLRIAEDVADRLIQRDNEDEDHGQRTRDAFHLADFFVHLDSESLDRDFNENVNRIVALIFGNRFVTPTFPIYFPKNNFYSTNYFYFNSLKTILLNNMNKLSFLFLQDNLDKVKSTHQHYLL